MGSMTDAEILQAALDGTLAEDDAQASQMDDLEARQGAGDTGTQGGDGAAGEKSADKHQGQAEGEGTETEVEGAPILSKSGAYTIPYEKLEQARDRAKTLEGENETLRAQIAELTATQQANLAKAEHSAQSRADAGQAPTSADENLAAATDAVAHGVDISVFGDFSEEAIARGVAEINRRAIEQAQTQLRAEMDSRLAKVEAVSTQQQEHVAQTAHSGHEAEILGAYADAYEIVESVEFQSWRKSLPAFARAGVERAIEDGSAQEVIEVLDAFRDAVPHAATTQHNTHSTKEQPAPEAPTKPRVPVSLSEVPGAAPVDETQQTLAMAGNSGALLDRVNSMTPEQREALMDRI